MNHGFERVKAKPGVPDRQFLIESSQSLGYRAAWSIRLWAARLNVNVRTLSKSMTNNCHRAIVCEHYRWGLWNVCPRSELQHDFGLLKN